MTKIYDESCNLVSGVALRKKRENGAGNAVGSKSILLVDLINLQSAFHMGIWNVVRMGMLTKVGLHITLYK